MEPVESALKIINGVVARADNVCVNQSQCKQLADRFRVIGKALTVASQHGAPVVEASAMEQILTVLKNGESLVESYADEKLALQNVLYRTDNREAFEVLHGDIKELGQYLDLGEPNVPLKSEAAETDRKHNVDQTLKHIPAGSNVIDIQNMEKVLAEKSSLGEPGYDLENVSYLNILHKTIKFGGAVSELKPLAERKSQADAHLDGLALVEKGTWNGIECAIKVFKSPDNDWNKQELHKEIESLVKLRHPHVTQLIGYGEHENSTYVLYELMDADLRDEIDARKKTKLFSGRPFSRSKEVSIITQIARGMFFLHEKGLVHGELKCKNLLVKKLGDHMDVKVADFHCSRQLGRASTVKYKPAHRPRWMPPEAFQHLRNDDNVDQPSDALLMQGDVYSFAMTCYEVITGKYPFDGVTDAKEIQRRINAGEMPKLPKELSKNLRILITKCWHRDPEHRPSFQDICYVLKVEAVRMFSSIERLFSYFGVCKGQPDAPEYDEGKDWSAVFPELQKLGPSDQDKIEDGAKHLPHYLRIRPSVLKPLRKLGSGASAEVYEASWIGCRFAMKWFKVEKVDMLRHEVSTMMKLLHPHVVRLVGFSVLFNRCAIVMELMDQSLHDLIKEKVEASSKQKRPSVPFKESEALGIMTKLALGTKYLHSQNVIHGDLKTANVLVRRGSTLDIKLVDFGFSRALGLASPSKQPDIVGWYRAPEVINKLKDIDRKAADVYSLAVLFYVVITGKEPLSETGLSYETKLEYAKCGSGVGLNLENVNVQPKLKQLLEDCWNLESEKRPKIDKVSELLASMMA